MPRTNDMAEVLAGWYRGICAGCSEPLGRPDGLLVCELGGMAEVTWCEACIKDGTAGHNVDEVHLLLDYRPKFWFALTHSNSYSTAKDPHEAIEAIQRQMLRSACEGVASGT